MGAMSPAAGIRRLRDPIARAAAAEAELARDEPLRRELQAIRDEGIRLAVAAGMRPAEAARRVGISKQRVGQIVGTKAERRGDD